VAGVAGLALYAYISRRARTVSDSVASTIDADAGLAGELRSARWFADRELRDAWAQFHVDRAAERLSRIDWTALYPPRGARRARAATATIAIAAVAISIAEPVHDWARAGARTPAPEAAPAAGQAAAATILISPELQKQLEALLDAAERGTLPADRQSAGAQKARELLDLLAQLNDAEALKALARAMDAEASERADGVPQQLTALAERAKRAAAMAATPPEIREALESLANDLAQAAADERLALAPSPEAAGVQEGQHVQTAKPESEAGAEALSIQSATDAGAQGGSTVIMMSSQGGGAGDAQPGAGPGGDAPFQKGTRASADLARALRRETVEASEDDQGRSVMTDARRKTERGRAAVSFTGGAAGTFDRSRASTPPAVPESRRADVRTYFIRTP
jgi:hypothetical protein